MNYRLCKSIAAAAVAMLFATTVSDAAASTRSPPGFHHGRKVGWHGQHHPPGWAHGRKVGWHHGTAPPGLRR
jgi:Spy/CpxP family protein refolding chaperone